MSDPEPQLRVEPLEEPSLKLSTGEPAGAPQQDGAWRLSAGDRIVPVAQERGGHGGLLAVAGIVAAVGAVAGYLMIGSGSSMPPPVQTSSTQPALIEPVPPAKPVVAEAQPPAPPPIETGALQASAAPEVEAVRPEPNVTASVAPSPEPPAAEPPPPPPAAAAIVNAPAVPPAPVAPAPAPTAPAVSSPAKSVAAPPAAKPNIINAPSGTASAAPPKKPTQAEQRGSEQKVARAELPPPSGLKSSPLPPAAPAPRSAATAMAPLPPVSDGRPSAPPPLRPASVDSRDPLQMRAAAVGLHPQLPSDLLARLSPDDFHNAEVAIRTAVAETPEGTVFVWPRQPWPDAAQFRVRLVRAARPDCHRYIVTITKDGWTTTAPPMETCEGPVNRRY